MRSVFNGSFFSSSSNSNTTNPPPSTILSGYNSSGLNNISKQPFNASTQLLFNHNSKTTEPASAAINNHYKNEFSNANLKHSESHPHLSASAITPQHSTISNNIPQNATIQQSNLHKHYPAIVVPSSGTGTTFGGGQFQPLPLSNLPPSHSSNHLSQYLQSLVHGSPAASTQHHQQQQQPHMTHSSTVSSNLCSPSSHRAGGVYPRAKLGEVVSCLVNKWSSEFLELSKQGDIESMCVVQKYSQCKGFGLIHENQEEARRLLERIKEAGRLQELTDFYQENESTGDSSGSISSVQSGYVSTNSDRATTPLLHQSSNNLALGMKPLPSIAISHPVSQNSNSMPNTPLCSDERKSYSQSAISASATQNIAGELLVHQPAMVSRTVSANSNVPPLISSSHSVPLPTPHLLEHPVACHAINPRSSKDANLHMNNILLSTPSPSSKRSITKQTSPPSNSSLCTVESNLVNAPLHIISSPTDSPTLSSSTTPISADSNRRFSITI